MHPQQVQAIVAMIDGLAGQLGALRQMMAGSLPPRRPQPQQMPQQQYLNEQEEALLDQAVGVPPPQMQPTPGWGQPQQPAYPPQQPWGQAPQQFAPTQAYPPQQHYQQPPQPFQPPPPPQRPYIMPNNLGQAPVPDFGALAPEAPAPNQRAIMAMMQAAVQGGAPLDPNQMQG